MSDENHTVKNPCPACGVAVAPGYPNCPKCKAPLTKGVERSGSGTAVDGRQISLYLVLLLAGLTAAATYLANRDDPEERGAPIVAARGDGEPTATSDGGPMDAGPGSEEGDNSAERIAILQNLEKVLDRRGVRVWADLDQANQGVLLIRSDDCEEVEIQVGQFPENVAEVASVIRCVGRFGEQVFQGKLK